MLPPNSSSFAMIGFLYNFCSPLEVKVLIQFLKFDFQLLLFFFPLLHYFQYYSISIICISKVDFECNTIIDPTLTFYHFFKSIIVPSKL